VENKTQYNHGEVGLSFTHMGNLLSELINEEVTQWNNGKRKKISDLMDMYRGTLEKDKFIAKRFRPLHKHLRNL
jgi:hypothetical protein